MCRFDKIANTSVVPCDLNPTLKRGISMSRIEYMTNIVFTLAKKLQQPLDKTMELLDRNKDATRILYNSYRVRNEVGFNAIVHKLYNLIAL